MGLGDEYSLIETKRRKRVIVQNMDSPSNAKYGDYADAWMEKTGKPTRVKIKNVRRVLKKRVSDYELGRYSWNR